VGLKNEQRDHEEIHQGHRDRTRRAKENPRHPTESAAVTEHSRTTEIVAVSIEGDGRMSECEHPDCDLEGREFTSFPLIVSITKNVERRQNNEYNKETLHRTDHVP
jgi:hypothetical protein